MANIKVDHTKLVSAAEAVERDITAIKSKMLIAQFDILKLVTGWSGKDADLFMKKWKTNYDKDSAYINTVNQMEEYARYLRFCAKKYKDAQTNAINRANKLPK